MSTFFKILDFIDIPNVRASTIVQRNRSSYPPTMTTVLTELCKDTLSHVSGYLWKATSYNKNFIMGKSKKRRLLDEKMNERFEYYEKKMNNAETYEDWHQAASKLDHLEGLMDWIEEPQSKHYDWQLLQARIDEIIQSRQLENDRKSMTFTLRLGQTRNLGDMGNATLYRKTRVGTKKLISDYTDEVIEQLNWIGDTADVNEEDEKFDDMTLKERHDYFMTLRQSHGRTALLLSGGGTLGFFHMGVMKALANARLLPRIISGASTGSIMASIICTINEEERLKLLNSPWSIPMKVFEHPDSPDTFLLRLNRYLTEGNLYDPKFLKEVIVNRLGDITFQEAYNRSRLILNITISSNSLFEMPRLLNYITAPDVVVWSAVLASCAVPLVYPSQEILLKSKTGELIPWTATVDKYRDGSIDNDLPLKRISEIFGINHFVVVQINPHIAPFIHTDHSEPSIIRTGINFFLQMVKEEIQHRCSQLKELGIAPTGLRRFENVLAQRYIGDITIAPVLTFKDVRRILSNPEMESVSRFIKRGERATWKQMSRIKYSLKIELAIDAAIYKLRSKLLGESPQMPQVVSVTNNDYIMALSPSNSFSNLNPTPSISRQSSRSQSFSDHFQSTDDEDEDIQSSSSKSSNTSENSHKWPVSPTMPSTPMWQINNFEKHLLSWNSNISISSSSSTPLNSNLRRPSLLPHDISRRGSNVSIRDISPSTSTKFERRKQITSAQFFISPDFEWAPKTSGQDFTKSVSILGKKGAQVEASLNANNHNKKSNLSIHIPTNK